MEILSAVSMLLQLTSAASSLMASVQSIGATIAKAQAEGRTTFTEEEWAAIKALDDAARAQLADEIKARGG